MKKLGWRWAFSHFGVGFLFGVCVGPRVGKVYVTC
jgi:hypothetical protein